MAKATKIESLTIAQLTALYNTAADKQIKKFQSSDYGLKRIAKLCEAKGLVVNEAATALVAAGKKAARKATGSKKANGTRRTRARFTEDMVIVVLRSEQPKRTTKRNPYSVYKTGMTIAKALEKGVLRRDVNYDASPDRKGGAVIDVMTREAFAKRK